MDKMLKKAWKGVRPSAQNVDNTFFKPMELRQGAGPKYGTSINEKRNCATAAPQMMQHVANNYETAPWRWPKIWNMHRTNMKRRQGANPK